VVKTLYNYEELYLVSCWLRERQDIATKSCLLSAGKMSWAVIDYCLKNTKQYLQASWWWNSEMKFFMTLLWILWYRLVATYFLQLIQRSVFGSTGATAFAVQ